MTLEVLKKQGSWSGKIKLLNAQAVPEETQVDGDIHGKMYMQF